MREKEGERVGERERGKGEEIKGWEMVGEGLGWERG